MSFSPFTPMSPILTDRLPSEEDWIYQLKWDGYRAIAWVNNGHVELYSKRMLLMNSKFPELVKQLESLPGAFMLDGEIVVLDHETQRPSFQKLQQRGRLRESSQIRSASEREPVQYILFDLLHLNGKDLRGMALSRRMEELGKLAADWSDPLFLVDTFDNGDALWQWVDRHGWEGVVSKRLSSTYKEGKLHKDWLKKKTVLRVEAEVVGILFKDGRVSSLAMRRDGVYFGRVSSGLNGELKAALALMAMDDKREKYFKELPEGLRGTDVKWLLKPLSIELSGREFTEGGSLRHPQIVTIGGKTL